MGKKPHSRRKSAQKSTTKWIAGILDDACEDDHIHRTALSTPCSVSFTQNFPPPLVQQVNIPLMYAPVHNGQNFEDSLVASPIDTSAGASPINNSAWISPTTTTGTPASPTEVSAWANVSGGTSPANTSFFSFCLSKEISQCNGCGDRNLQRSDGKPHTPPDDLCLQHKEYNYV